MYCTNCGIKNEDIARFCKDCGALLPSTQVTSIRNDSTESKSVKEDSANVFLIILSAIIPLIGFVLYFQWKKDTPKKANTILISSLIGAVVNLLIYLA